MPGTVLCRIAFTVAVALDGVNTTPSMPNGMAEGQASCS